MHLGFGMVDQSCALIVGGAEGESVKDYRKGDWRLNETLVLITAKKMDDKTLVLH